MRCRGRRWRLCPDHEELRDDDPADAGPCARTNRTTATATARIVYTWPSRKAFASIMAKVKAISKQGTHQSLADLLCQINVVLRG